MDLELAIALTAWLLLGAVNVRARNAPLPYGIWIVAGAVWLCLGVLRDAAFPEDELQCEEAAAHLQSCCAQGPSLFCRFEKEGGCDYAQPDLSPAESRCIRALSCAEIRDRMLCTREYNDYTTRSGEPPVCE